MDEVKNHWRKWMYWFILALAVIVVYKALDNFSQILGGIGRFFGIIGPFLAGVFIAYILYMPCTKTEEFFKRFKLKMIRKRARGLSILTTYIIVLVLISILINWILPVVTESIKDFIGNIQGYYETAINNYDKLPEDSLLKHEIVKEEINNIQKIDIKQYLNFDRIIGYLLSAVSAMTSLFDVFVAVIVSIYVLAERDQILTAIKKIARVMFKDHTYNNIDKYFNNSNEIFFKFIASQFVDAIIVGVLVTIALSIMKVKYAPLLGFTIGLFNMIPYFGAIIAVGIAALITLITGGLSQTIWMLIVVVVLQQIDANIINPKIVGQSLKISPLLVIFSVTVGGAYFGILGMFLAVPIMAIIRILVEDYINFKLETKKNIE